jgi:hypothetical protein
MPAASENGDPSKAAQAGHGRAASNAFIAFFLLCQVAMPLRYYLGGRGDDERFSWRMFSSVRMHKCTVRVQEVVAGRAREVELGHAMQIAWIGMLERNRPQVVTKLLRRRCQERGVSEARYHRSCTGNDGGALPPLELAMDCASGALASHGGKP